jgi:hypothetical protein
MNLGRNGWGIMIGWTIWIVIVPLIVEISQILFIDDKKGVEKKN